MSMPTNAFQTTNCTDCGTVVNAMAAYEGPTYDRALNDRYDVFRCDACKAAHQAARQHKGRKAA